MILETDYKRVTENLEKMHEGGVMAGDMLAKIVRFLVSKIGMLILLVVCGAAIIGIGILRGMGKKKN